MIPDNYDDDGTSKAKQKKKSRKDDVDDDGGNLDFDEVTVIILMSVELPGSHRFFFRNSITILTTSMTMKKIRKKLLPSRKRRCSELVVPLLLLVC